MLSLLRSVAPEFGATLEPSSAEGQIALKLTLPSGHECYFSLVVQANESHVVVMEAEPRQLPAFCPDRHINSDGSFCLGWGAEDPRVVTDMESARIWWATLVRFLQRQHVATQRRQWPGNGHDRAHGDAALDQATAERCADMLGPDFARDLRRGRITVRHDGRRANPRLELWRGEKRIARAFVGSGQLVSARLRCPCDDAIATRAAIADCRNHEQVIEALILAIHRWRIKERDYLQDLVREGRRCCGTLSACGLRDAERRGPLPSARQP